MANIDELISRIPMSRIAEMLGVDEETAASATRTAVPALVKGMQANAQDDQRAASLAQAIGQHAQALRDRGAEPDLDSVDTDDGARIVNHVFGDNEDQVANQLGGLGGGSGLFKKLLPMLAPMVMGFLAKQFTDRGGADDGSARQQADSGGGLGDLLGGGLGGLLGGGGESTDGGGGGLSDLLGGLLGGGANDEEQSGGGGGLGDLLGGLLGGGRR